MVYFIVVAVLLVRICSATLSLDGLLLCQSNCVSSERLSGPTRMQHTRDHPWKVAQYPTAQSSFCKLGCQLFFSELPKNTTCKNNCDYYYRYQITAGYSDVAEEAKLECKDGCEIALQVCQAGFYCNDGQMLACPAGKYREAVTDISIVELATASECTNCPRGRYRAQNKGKSADDCNLCPIGKYVNATGSTRETDCLRCPAGQTAEQPGSALCRCITAESCDMPITVSGQETQDFFQNGVDYFRETVPFIGRW